MNTARRVVAIGAIAGWRVDLLLPLNRMAEQRLIVVEGVEVAELCAVDRGVSGRLNARFGEV